MSSNRFGIASTIKGPGGSRLKSCCNGQSTTNRFHKSWCRGINVENHKHVLIEIHLKNSRFDCQGIKITRLAKRLAITTRQHVEEHFDWRMVALENWATYTTNSEKWKKYQNISLLLSLTTILLSCCMTASLLSLKQTSQGGLQVIVIDNNSSDRTLGWSKTFSLSRLLPTNKTKALPKQTIKVLGQWRPKLAISKLRYCSQKTLVKPLKYLKTHPKVGAVTIKLL